jgi:hypothetical protein
VLISRHASYIVPKYFSTQTEERNGEPERKTGNDGTNLKSEMERKQAGEKE